MRTLRVAGPICRVALAALFGFMSLAHGPVMGFARSNLMAAQQVTAVAASTHDQHQHHHQPHHQPAPAMPDSAPTDICNGLGCFQAVSIAPVGAPQTQLLQLGKLVSPPARAIVPAVPEPAVPPPRLQV